MNDHPSQFSRYSVARPLRRTKFFPVSASEEPNNANDLRVHQQMEAQSGPLIVNERGQRVRTLPHHPPEKREQKQSKPLAGTRPWRPGTFGFDGEGGDPGFEIDSTI